MRKRSRGRISQRILFVSQLFDPEPTFKGLAFAKALASHGFRVEVVTGFPNYPGGKLYQGYRIRWLSKEIIDNVLVTRLAMFPYHGRSIFLRTLCYASFCFAATIYLTVSSRRDDIIYVFYPAITAGLSAIIAKFVRRCKVVIDIQDLWPDSLEATGVLSNRYIRVLIDLVCQLQYRNADRLCVLSQGFMNTLLSRGARPDQVRVIYNWADETILPQVVAPNGYNPHDGFRVLFAGNIGAAQGLSALVTAAEIVRRARPDISIYIMGDGIELSTLKKQALGSSGNIIFLPRVPLTQVQRYLKEADCLLIHLRPDKLFSITIPSKTQAYLYAGRPIVIAAHGEAASLVERAGAGIAARPGDPEDIARAIVRLRDTSLSERIDMGRRGREFYEANMSFNKGVHAFVELFCELAPPGLRPLSRRLIKMG